MHVPCGDIKPRGIATRLDGRARVGGAPRACLRAKSGTVRSRRGAGFDVPRLCGADADLLSSYRNSAPAFDAVAESLFDDTQAMKALAASPEYAEVLADETNFIDRSTMQSIITDEHVIKDLPAPANAIKSITLMTRKDGMAIDAFRAYWLDVHGPSCAAVPAIRRYVQHPTRRSIYDSGGTPAFDGAAMTWFDSMDALRAAAPTPEFARLRAEVEQFVAQDRSPTVLTQEHVFVA